VVPKLNLPKLLVRGRIALNFSGTPPDWRVHRTQVIVGAVYDRAQAFSDASGHGWLASGVERS